MTLLEALLGRVRRLEILYTGATFGGVRGHDRQLSLH